MGAGHGVAVLHAKAKSILGKKHKDYVWGWNKAGVGRNLQGSSPRAREHLSSALLSLEGSSNGPDDERPGPPACRWAEHLCDGSLYSLVTPAC